MSTSLTIGIIFAIASVVCVLLDPLWLRVGGGYWRFTPMLRRLRLSPRLRDREHLEQLLTRLGALWGCPIEWRRSAHGIEFHGRGLVNQWLGAGRIVDLDGEGWLSVEIPFRQAFLLPFACANVLLIGPLGWPVAAGLMLSVVTAFLVQRTFAQRVELVARLLVMKPEAREAVMRVARMRAELRARGRT
jgi:hypothetical protein